VNPVALSAAIRACLLAAVDAGELTVDVPGEIRVERPRQREHGDWSTNVAMQLARTAGKPPREVAGAVAARLGEVPGVKSVEIAGPGFLNIVLDAAAGEFCTIVEAARPTGVRTRGGENVNPSPASPTGRSISAAPVGPPSATACPDLRATARA
jgi:arginyl-tRNA synthetase